VFSVVARGVGVGPQLFRFSITGRNPSSQLNFRCNCGPEHEVLTGSRLTGALLFASRKLACLGFAMPTAKQFRRLAHIATARD
jgi:hypothetical protein